MPHSKNKHLESLRPSKLFEDNSHRNKARLPLSPILHLRTPAYFLSSVKAKSLRWYMQPKDFRQTSVDLALSYEDMTLSAVKVLSHSMLRQAHYSNKGNQSALEQTLARCIETFNEDLDENEVIHKLLKLIGVYYQADRVRLYELDKNKTLLGDPHEWVSTPHAAIYSIFRMTREETALLVDIFKAQGQYIIQDIDNEIDHSMYVYKSLKERQVKSLILVPIFSKKKIIAFIDVENAQREKDNPMLLHSLSFFMRENLKHLILSEKLESVNQTDKVTGLFNREKYRERLNEIDLINLNTLGVIRLDVNGLKGINALYGEDYGDYVLAQTSNLLRKHVPNNDLFRLGNGEFLVLLPNSPQQEFNAIVNAIRDHEAAIDEYSLAVGALWRWQDVDAQLVIANAGEIMLAEKQKYYKDLPVDHVHRRLNPATIVLSEIADGLFSIYLQPKVELSTGKIIGAEALIRKKQKKWKTYPSCQIYSHL